MDLDEFWALVEQARADAFADASADGEPPSGSAVGEALATRLARLPAERVVEFQRRFERVAARAHQWDLCAAAYVITSYISDDGFNDFKAGLVSLGRDAFERVVAQPDALADHPVVRAIAAGRAGRFVLMAAEAMHFAAAAAYERSTGDADAFWEALEARDTGDDEEGPPADGWSGRFGDAEDAARIPRRLPRLHALFSEHARPAEDSRA